MSKVSNNQNVDFEFTPWTDKGYRIQALQMKETLGGNIAKGTMELWFNGSDDALKLVTDQLTGELTVRSLMDDGQEYKMPIYIVNRSFHKNVLFIEFRCIEDNKFFTEQTDIDFEDISDALNKLYPGEVTIRTSSDVGNNIKIFQFGDSNFDLCTRLAWSFKKDIVFGYGFDRLIIKDLIGTDSKGNKEPSIELSDTVMKSTHPYKLDYNKDLNYKVHDTWEKDYSNSEKVNPVVYLIGGELRYSCSTHKALLENYMYNTSRFKSGFYSKLEIKSSIMPDYRLGDVVKYKTNDQKTDYPFQRYLVASNELFYSPEASKKDSSGLGFSWTTTLLGLDRGEWNNKEDEE